MIGRTSLAALAALAFASAPALAQTSGNESLSKQLSKSDGVIKPNTNVDPGMKVPAPDPTPHSTPVIPPSATGGDTAK